MLAVRRSACFYTTVGLCETSTLFFFFGDAAAAADAGLLLATDRPTAAPNPTCMQTRCCTCLGLSIIN